MEIIITASPARNLANPQPTEFLKSMLQQSEISPFLKDLFPGAGGELLRLLQSGTENAFLLRSDFYAIRDWIEIADYRTDEVPVAILLLMLVALEEGSLCIEASAPSLLRRLRDFVPAAEAATWTERILHALDQVGFPRLIGAAPTDHKPIVLHTIAGQRFLYFQKYLRAEFDFHRALTERLQAAPEPVAVDWAIILRNVLGDQPLSLDRDQQLALGTTLLHNVAIVSGGPGTGKTSIVLTLLRCLVRGGFARDRIALAAPTGRAAQRLTDALRAGLDRIPSASASDSPDLPLRDLSATTLHQLLAYRPSRNLFARHRENPIPADVVIVDEASMIGLVLMSHLFHALDPRTKLVLLGDKDQLPSVEAGAVLADLVPEGRGNAFHGESAARLRTLFPDQEIPRTDRVGLLQNRVVLLQTNHRSQQQIRETALAINRQDATVVDRMPTLSFPTDGSIDAWWRDLEAQGGCRLLEQKVGSANELHGFLQQWAEQAYFRSRPEGGSLAELAAAIELNDDDNSPDQQARFRHLFRLLDRFRLLTLVRESAWGCDEINHTLEQYLRPRMLGQGHAELFAGAPVLITRNDASRGLNNGDVGVALRQRGGGGLRVLFPQHNSFVAVPAEALPAHELGFALTVHKSQGSEYAHVMVVLPPTGAKRLLTKELIYTAITRAKSLAVICAAKDMLKTAIERRIVRESGLLRFT